jgi:hypothetical protein
MRAMTTRLPRIPALLVLLLALHLAVAPAARAAGQNAALQTAAQQSPGRQSAVVVPSGTAGGHTRLVVALPPGGGKATPPVSVTVDGTPQPATTVPLLSDRLAMAIVVDASTDGGRVLQPGLSGVVDFVLGAPGAARTALVADTAPPAVVTPLQSGPADLLSGLSALQPRGDRQTLAALDLAVHQLPPGVEDPRLVVLYTAAPDAPGRSAADLGAELSAAGIVLGVVTTAAGGGPVPPYWSAATAATGGTAISARGPEAVDGFTRLAAALRSRYLVTVPAPERFPANVAVQVDGADRPVTAEAVVPAPPAPRAVPAAKGTGSVVGPALVVVVLVLVVAAMALAARLRAGRVRQDAHGDGRAATGAVPPAWDVPTRPEPVADRAALLAATSTAARSGRPAVLYDDGPPGLGATTAMIEFAHRNRRAYDVVWWVAAEDLPLVKDRLAELAEVLGLAGPDDTAGAATDRLRDALGRTDRWLVLFDDPPGPDELTPLLPARSGHVLVASTDPRWREHGAALAVPRLERAESVGLLQARHSGLSAAEADRVAAAAHDVPLALTPAAGTLADTGMTVDDYLRAVSAHGRGGEDPVWSVAVERLATDDPPALALLTFAAWLAPHPVPLTLLTEQAALLPPPLTEVAPGGLEEQAATLQRRGLARLDADSLRLHAASATRLRTRTAGERPGDVGWAAVAVRVLHAAVVADPAGRSTWRQLLPHVLAATDPTRDLDEVGADVGKLLQLAGRHLQARGEARSALALLTDAHDLYRQQLGADHPDTVASARDLECGSTIPS